MDRALTVLSLEENSRHRVQAWYAGTTFPNTPETDKLPLVYHTVKYSIDHGDTQVAYIMAKEPGDAINRANNMTVAEITALSTKPIIQSYEETNR